MVFVKDFVNIKGPLDCKKKEYENNFVQKIKNKNHREQTELAIEKITYHMIHYEVQINRKKQNSILFFIRYFDSTTFLCLRTTCARGCIICSSI